MTVSAAKSAAPADSLSARLVDARLKAEALPTYPGTRPASLPEAYACQDAAIARWPDSVAGWKIGRLLPDEEQQFGVMRLAGPIFRKDVREADAARPTDFPVFAGGFAAVEAEFVLRLKADAPADKLRWSKDEAAGLVDAVHIGIETAGSPLPTINDLGGTVIISDFGNNAGLILGPVIAEGLVRDPKDLKATMRIDGAVVGIGEAARLPGGPVEALRFLLENCASRGMPLRRGQLISTGAVTGVHDIRIGQSAVADFGADGCIACHAVKAMPRV